MWLAVGCATLCSVPVHAAMVSYYLDQTNELVDGPELSARRHRGAGPRHLFHRNVAHPLPSIAPASGSGFGMQSVGFNIAGSGTLSPNVISRADAAAFVA
jgi:hypothetical protein